MKKNQDIYSSFNVMTIWVFSFLKTNFAEYNIEKSISACVVAQKRTSEIFDLEKSKKYCKEQVTKQKENY